MARFDKPALPYLFAVYAAWETGHRGGIRGPAGRTSTSDPDLPSRHGRHINASQNPLETAWLTAAVAAGEALRQAERRTHEAESTREKTARRRVDKEHLGTTRELPDSRAGTHSLRTGRRNHPNVRRKQPKPFRYIDDAGGTSPACAGADRLTCCSISGRTRPDALSSILTFFHIRPIRPVGLGTYPQAFPRHPGDTSRFSGTICTATPSR